MGLFFTSQKEKDELERKKQEAEKKKKEAEEAEKKKKEEESEKLIAVAVRFLQNDKVKDATMT
jgi:hypothetical protein